MHWRRVLQLGFIERGFENAAEAFVFFDWDSKEVLDIVCFRIALRRLKFGEARDISAREAVEALAMADGSTLIGANRFVELLDWSEDGVVGAQPVQAVDAALAARKTWEERVANTLRTVPQVRMSHSSATTETTGEVSAATSARVRRKQQLWRNGQRALKLARVRMIGCGLESAAEAFAYFDKNETKTSVGASLQIVLHRPRARTKCTGACTINRPCA